MWREKTRDVLFHCESLSCTKAAKTHSFRPSTQRTVDMSIIHLQWLNILQALQGWFCENCRGKKTKPNNRQHFGPICFCHQSLSADQQPFNSNKAPPFKNQFSFEGTVKNQKIQQHLLNQTEQSHMAEILLCHVLHQVSAAPPSSLPILQNWLVDGFLLTD